MTLHLLRPTGSTGLVGWTLVGAANAVAALSDASDASYVSAGVGAQSYLTIALEDATDGMIPPSAQVRFVLERYRIRRAAGGTVLGGSLRLGTSLVPSAVIPVTAAFVTYAGSAALSAAPDGGAWSNRHDGTYSGNGVINALEALLVRDPNALDAQFAEVDLVVSVNEAPNSTRAPADVVTTSGSLNITSAREAAFRADDVGKPITGVGIPAGSTIATVTPASDPSRASSATLSAGHAATASGTITATIGVLTWITGPADPDTTTSRPTVSWTYTDPEGDIQERYRVKIFSAAQYNAPGFLPWGSTSATGVSTPASASTWDSGEVLSAATSAVVGVDLTNGVTYRAYVAVADAGSGGRYNVSPDYATASLQTYQQFTMALTPPPNPTLIAAPDTANARVVLTITAGAGNPTTEYFIVERSDDGGMTWVYVRGGKMLTNPASGTAPQTLYDYEAPRDTSLLYRARSVDTGTGQVVASGETQAGPLTLSPSTDSSACVSWLKSASNPALTMVVIHADTRFESRSSENSTAYETEGRADPIIHAGTVRSESFNALSFKFDTDAQWHAFEALRALKEPLLFQTAFGDNGLEQYWVRLGPDRSVIRMSSNRMHNSQDRQVTVPAREVRRPTVT